MNNDENIYYTSIGYPIGLCINKDNEKFFNVEDNGKFIGLYHDSYAIWKFCFLGLKTKNEIIKSLNLSSFLIENEINRLKNEKILIEIKTNNTNEIYDTLKDFYLLKNGFGQGLSKEEDFSIIINQGQPFKIEIKDFCLWSLCNNRNKISYFIDWYSKEYNCTQDIAKYQVINIILRLKTIDLIRLSH